MVFHGYGIVAVICFLLMEAGSLGNLAGEVRLDSPDYQPPLTEYRSQQQYHSHGQPFNTPPMYQQPNINVPVVNTNNSTPLIVELLLSIFLGIYRVGWLMAAETAGGIRLSSCSRLIYLPLFIRSV